jgi:PPM family protein phosphatase
MDLRTDAQLAHSLRWSGHTDRGRIRKNNEDTFLGLHFDANDLYRLGKFGEAPTERMDFVFAVSDGMGGAMSGEFASSVTVDKVTRLLPPAFKRTASGISVDFDDVLPELFQQIHRALTHLSECYEECAGMGATLSLGWFTPGWMYFAHVGDSRVYYLPAAGGIKQLSHDDTHVGWLFRNGQINEREARNHPRRNVLQKALGAGNQFVDPQLGAVGFEPGDRFLLCTDGVTDGLYDHHIEDLLRAPSATHTAMTPAHRLVQMAVEHSGRDNATALVVEAV